MEAGARQASTMVRTPRSACGPPNVLHPAMRVMAGVSRKGWPAKEKKTANGRTHGLAGCGGAETGMPNAYDNVGCDFATETVPVRASSCLQAFTIMQSMPPTRVATMPSMNMTLTEKPRLTPLTPDAPATLDGSLQPSQAKAIGRLASRSVTIVQKYRAIRYFVDVYRLRKSVPTSSNTAATTS